MLARSRALPALVALVVAGWPASARADLPSPRLVPELGLSKDKGVESAPEADPWTTRKRSINLIGGAPGSPTGVAGLSFEYAPIKYLVLGAGGGWAPEGARGAFMPRLRLPLNHWVAVGFGTPLAMGPYFFTARMAEQCEYAGCSTGFSTTRTWTMAVWGHVEPNVEVRLGRSAAVALRIYGGYGQLLNRDSDQCRSTLPNGCPSTIGESKWYGGLALGYAW
jgi:hypothetical protein